MREAESGQCIRLSDLISIITDSESSWPLLLDSQVIHQALGPGRILTIRHAEPLRSAHSPASDPLVSIQFSGKRADFRTNTMPRYFEGACGLPAERVPALAEWLKRSSHPRELASVALPFDFSQAVSAWKERIHQAEEEHRRRRIRRQELSSFRRLLEAQVANLLETDFFGVDEEIRDLATQLSELPPPPTHLLNWAEGKLEEWRATYLRRWLQTELQQPFDQEQALAASTFDQDVRVVARAGSGKTRTLVGRAAFLIQHCRVDPSQVMLLAFNRAAAAEMKERLEVLLPVPPHVFTFHALAYALVHPTESPLHDVEEADDATQSRFIDEVIHDYLRASPGFDPVRKVMMAYFRCDWEQIEAGGFQLPREDMLRLRRSLPRESLRGDQVKSYGEKVLADLLFEHDVPYSYERNYVWNGCNYRPDFTIFSSAGSGLILEYFGLCGDPGYDDQMEAKRRFWRQCPGWELVEVGPQEVVPNHRERLWHRLEGVLRKAGLQPRRLSEDEIWTRIRTRAVGAFTRAVRQFIGRARKQRLQPDDLDARCSAHQPLTAGESAFTEAGRWLYRRYLERLAATGDDDYDGLLETAIGLIASGHTRFQRRGEDGDVARLRHLFIDEGQDLSPLFLALVDAMRGRNADLRIFCVGDDWQSINGFAGTDLAIFQGLGSHFQPSVTRHVATNYRSRRQIVEAGNALMSGLGASAVASSAQPGKVWVADLREFHPTALETKRFSGDLISPACLRLISNLNESRASTLLLSRRNRVHWFIAGDAEPPRPTERQRVQAFQKRLRSLLPGCSEEHRLQVLTAHRSKGMEADLVIILDAVERAYPLLHPQWVFYRVFGDSPAELEAAERRLFYVALTRARRTVVLLTEGGARSPFLEELERRVRVELVDWSALPPPMDTETSHFAVEIYGPTYKFKDSLKAHRYRWSARERSWVRVDSVSAFDLARVQGDLASGPAGLRMRVRNDANVVVHEFVLRAGSWIPVS